MSSSSSDEVEERLDEIIDDIIDETYINIVEAHPSKPRTRTYIERDREIGHNQLWTDYFSEDATFPPYLFRRRFRMNKELFLRIVHRLSEHVPFFQQRRERGGLVFLHYKNVRLQFVSLLMVLQLTRLMNISELVKARQFRV